MFKHYLADDQARREYLSDDFAEWQEEKNRQEENEQAYHEAVVQDFLTWYEDKVWQEDEVYEYVPEFSEDSW